MGNTKFTKCFMIIALLLSGMIMSCQKDDDIKDVSAAVKADSTVTLNTPGNYLAVKGTLKITLQDSTYTFDAARDSVAFVNVNSGNTQYFGITAINKAHSMSFGISSAGYAVSHTIRSVAGSQLLLSELYKPNMAYSLPKEVSADDFGKINLTSYQQDSTLAVGTFYTFMAKDTLHGTPFYKVKGSFSLRLK